MAWCPNADCPHRRDTGEAAEYAEGTPRCAECGSPLRVDREAEPTPAPADLVTAATFRYLHEAELARSKLLAEGLDASIADAGVLSVNVLWGPALGWMKLQVPRDQVEQARLVLSEDHSTAAETEAAAQPGGEATVPKRKRHRRRVEPIPFGERFWIAWIVLAGLAVYVLRHATR